MSATAMRRASRMALAPKPAPGAQADARRLHRSPRIETPPVVRRRDAPRDDLGEMLRRCCAARAAGVPGPRQAVVQRMHVDGATAPAGLCKSFSAVAKLAANPYPTTLLNVFGIGDSPAVQANRLSQSCRAWLAQFDSSPVDHTKYAKLDFLMHDLEWPLETNADTWAQLRRRVIDWRTDAEERYVLDSEVSQKNMPDPEEYEEQIKLAWSGASGAFTF